MRRITFPAVLCALAVASPALAVRPVPFQASIATSVELPDPMCMTICAINITGSGQVTHMGRTSIEGPSIIDFKERLQTGTSTLTAADGSTLEIQIDGKFRPVSPTDVVFSGSWIVLSGTRRFADSDGGGTYHGRASLATGTGELFMDGTISDTGRH